MRAFLIAVAAILVISVGAGVVLTTLNPSSGAAMATDAVRLGGS